ncbi:NADPH:quinone reductase [Halalkalicoccus jeotgali]|uniref:Alcohol dehydrogenase GroES domain protein n=1 Tax=Halalkalicoccus jeotgali (strain DSM 18796 / CECT 7217 / JCM 14584 / KCTC 4019 / B3) TaxID=795797 RepID=D8JAQ0_HALJB|nr:NADPH:quinone reductase [Halalkalicoccus jeotgali]ADJ14772.1 Alcohol dehydrogenase GroES domain protein [Halalkalicoccus jeotgali B3]ELY39354.1 alcohol dehydrogenase GroES domain-containing protein [Halalkalicoccus jeotgali B3]
MRAVRYHDHGGPEVLSVEEIERPEPGGHELLVRVAAAGVNPVDTYFREGSFQPYQLPMTPGSDFSGVVEETGDWTAGFEAGDRVFGTGLGRDHQGTYAEYALVPTDRVAHLPENVDFDAGGGAGVAAVTAWRALIDHAGLEPAETCLIHGGSGGVGHAAVGLAAATGAEVVTTAAPEYHDVLEELGADTVLDYADEDLEEAVGKYEPAVILDHRLDEYLDFDAAVAQQGARIVGIGNTRPQAGWENVPAARAKELTVQLMSMFNTPDLSARLERVARLMERETLSIHVDRCYPLEEAGEAQRAVVEESFLGKLMVEP